MHEVAFTVSKLRTRDAGRKSDKDRAKAYSGRLLVNRAGLCVFEMVVGKL